MKVKNSHTFKFAIFGALIAVLAGLVTTLFGWGKLSDTVQDMRFGITNRAVTGQIVLVDIDEKSIALVGVWPWPRGIHARIVDRLVEAGASDIAFDVDFSSHSTALADSEFEKALQRADGRVTLAAERQRLSAADTHYSLVVPLPQFTNHAWIGLADVYADHGGTIRTVPGPAMQKNESVPALSVILAGQAVQASGTFRIDFGIDATGLDHISVADLLEGNVAAGRIAGKKMIVGATSLSLRDYFAVPRYGVISGSMVHAIAAETLIQGRALGNGVPALALAGILTVICFAFLAILLLPGSIALVATLGLSILVEGGAILLQDWLAVSLDTAGLHIALMGVVVVLAVREIVERGSLWRLARAEKRATQALLDRVFADSYAAIIVADGKGVIRAASRAALKMLGGNTPGQMIGAKAAEALPEPVSALLHKNGAKDKGTVTLDRAGGDRRVLEFTRSTSVLDEAHANTTSGHVICITLNDVTERLLAEEHIEQLARFDSLTRLPNRNNFMEQLLSIEHWADKELMLLNLDRFKVINQAMGHSWGDAVLRHMASLIRSAAGDDAFVARLDGDEFAILPGSVSAATCAGRMAHVLDQPLDLQGRRALLSVSIGIAHLGDIQDAGMATQRASLALADAKAAGGRTTRYYTAGSEAKIAARDAVEAELRFALERGEFQVFYQLQTGFASGGVVGAEALLRWQHPRRGLVSPSEFVDVLERTGMIVAIGAFVLRQACEDAVTWPAHLRIAVNVAVPQLISGDFARTVADILAQTGLDPSRLDLELTESLFIQDVNVVSKVLGDLRALGVGLALDDFGTGYSSLAYIKRFPVTKVKLDRAFVRDLPESRESVAIVQAVTAIARALDLKVLAEGVETPEQYSAVRLLGCDEVQGFLLARPLPQAQLCFDTVSALARKYA